MVANARGLNAIVGVSALLVRNTLLTRQPEPQRSHRSDWSAWPERYQAEDVIRAAAYLSLRKQRFCGRQLCSTGVRLCHATLGRASVKPL